MSKVASLGAQTYLISLFHAPNGFTYLGLLVVSKNVFIKVCDWLI